MKAVMIAFRVFPLLFALAFFSIGVNWIVDPAEAARTLEMELLTGMGASTQIGDMGAFFFSCAALIGVGSLTGRSAWLHAPALLLALAALMRTLAWVLGNAGFGGSLIVSEVVVASVLIAAARLRSEEPRPG